MLSSHELLDAITQATPAGLDTLASELKSRANLPEHVAATLDEAGDHAPLLLRAIDQAAATYARAHGKAPRGDAMDAALLQAFSLTRAAGMALDSATAHQADPLSLQPHRAVVVLQRAIADAIPWAHYLPTDIGSNEARLAITALKASSDFGRYSAGDVLNGGNAGLAYLTSSRVHTLEDTAGTWSGKLTTVQTDSESCDQTADGVKLIRGRTLVYLRGRVIGQETSDAGSGASTVSGAVTIGSTTHALSGTINTDTGVAAITFTPALPGGYTPVVEGFVDFERAPGVVPELATEVDVFRLFAKPWRATVPRISVDAATQLSNELRLDPLSMIDLAIRHQFALERHYDVLAKAARAAADNTESFNFDYITRGGSMARADIWSDVSGVLEVVSQQMASDTRDHGVSHIYVGAKIAGQLRGAGTYFESSGLVARPHVYRVGRLFGEYDVYYSPTIAEAADGSTGSMLCVGVASDVTRNVAVLGDAVAPAVVPLSMGADLRSGAGFYARNFTAVNPHEPSARGAALINVTNMV